MRSNIKKPGGFPPKPPGKLSFDKDGDLTDKSQMEYNLYKSNYNKWEQYLKPLEEIFGVPFEFITDNKPDYHYLRQKRLGLLEPLRLKYDAIQLKVHVPTSQLTQDGLLVWTSPSRYIKADKDGSDIKGGALEVETLVTDTLQVYGDITAFGQMVTTDLTPYTDAATNIGTDGSPGATSEVRYAKGDHVHDLTFPVLNTVAQEDEFTNITITSTGTGSFGMGHFGGSVGIGTTSPPQELTVEGDISSSGNFYLGKRGVGGTIYGRIDGENDGYINIGGSVTLASDGVIWFKETDANVNKHLVSVNNGTINVNTATDWAYNSGDKLYVHGNLRTSEDVYIGSGSSRALYFQDSSVSLKRETQFVDFLESIDTDDAKLILYIKDKRKLPYSRITKKLFEDAWPALASTWSNKEKKNEDVSREDRNT